LEAYIIKKLRDNILYSEFNTVEEFEGELRKSLQTELMELARTEHSNNKGTKSQKIPFVNITSPKNRDEVSWKQIVDGSSSATNGSGLHVSVLIWSMKGGAWWTQSTTTREDGSWQSDAQFGNDPESDPENSRCTYRIVAIITPQELEGNQEFADIPSNVARSNKIIVTRTTFNEREDLREAQERADPYPTSVRESIVRSRITTVNFSVLIHC